MPEYRTLRDYLANLDSGSASTQFLTPDLTFGTLETGYPPDGSVSFTKLSDDLQNQLDAAAAFGGLPEGYEAAENVVQMAAPVVEGIFQNMLQEYTTYSGDVAPNYSMRTIEWRREVGSTMAERIVSPDRPFSASSMGHVLRFMAKAARVWPEKRTVLFPAIRRLAQIVTGFQVESPRWARYGGFTASATSGQCSVYNAAQCGLGLLEAYLLTDDANYLESAILAGNFIKRLMPANLNAFYSSQYGVTPVPTLSRNGFDVSNVWLTAIEADDTVRRQVSLWDGLSLKFLHELSVVTGDSSWESMQSTARDFYIYGLQNGYEVFSIYDTTTPTKCNDTWYVDNNIDATNARDHLWHRRGETVLATPLGGGAAVPVNTIGTDQIEYCLEGLYDSGYAPSAVDSLYAIYRNLQVVKGSATQASTIATYNGQNYLPGLCFSGYIRVDTSYYLASTDPAFVPGTRTVQYGDHYDVQGVGPLLRYKYERQPADFALSIQAALLAGGTMSTLLNADLTPRWSSTNDYEYLTYGIGNVIGTIGLGLIEVIASLGE